MKQYFKNRFFYIATVVVLLLTIVPGVFYSMGLTFVLRDAVCVLLMPMQKLFNSAAEAADGFASYFYKFDELAEENAELRQEISELKSQIYEAEELEEMYIWMSDYLELKMRHDDFKLTAANVTGRESGSYSKILTLDVGAGAGIELNMPVITSDGIVGRITEVGYTWSKVTTIVESNSALGAYIELTGDSGVCEGSYELSSDGYVLLNYLSSDSTPEPGQRVLSTGFGSIYPRGLCVGYIDSVDVNRYSRGKTVKVKCAVDFSELTDVMIITSYESTAADASELAR